MSIEEFDSLTDKRIERMVKLQSRRLEERNARMKAEQERADREAARKRIMKK